MLRRALAFDRHNLRRTRLRLPTPLEAQVHLDAKLLRSVLQAAGQPTPHQSRRRKSASGEQHTPQRSDKRTLSRPPLITQREVCESAEGSGSAKEALTITPVM